MVHQGQHSSAISHYTKLHAYLLSGLGLGLECHLPVFGHGILVLNLTLLVLTSSHVCCHVLSVTCHVLWCGCRQYQWVDERGRRTKCSAAQYVDHVMSMTQALVSDETVFPTKYGLHHHYHCHRRV